MTAPTAWHLDGDLVDRYRAGQLPPAAQASVEAHVVVCSACQRLFATGVAGPAKPAAAEAETTAERAVAPATPTPARATTGDPGLDLVWAAIIDELDRPRPGPAERVLAALGVRPDLARLIAATPALRGAWLLAVALTLAFAVSAARAEGGSGLVPLLLLAPMVPVAGTAAAFGPRFDPVHEIALAAPVHGFRLLLVRSAAVLATGVAACALATLLTVGATGWGVLAWVLPSFALTAATLALSTWVPLTTAGAVSAGAWVAAVVVMSGRVGGGRLALRLGADDLLDGLLAGDGQLVFAALTVAFLLVATSRRDAFDQRSPA